METIHDIRLLLAVLAPLVGAGLVMTFGKRPNLRETCSFLAAAALFGITASMIPLVLQGKLLHLTLFQLIPADAKSTAVCRPSAGSRNDSTPKGRRESAGSFGPAKHVPVHSPERIAAPALALAA